MIPIEVTHTVLFTSELSKRLEKLNSNFGNFIKELLLFFKDAYSTIFNFEFPPLHDPVNFEIFNF
jgi:purine nucleosidase